MSRYNVYGSLSGTHFLGQFEAKTPEEAVEKGLAGSRNYVSLCHQCSDHFELNDISCSEAEAELADDPSIAASTEEKEP